MLHHLLYKNTNNEHVYGMHKLHMTMNRESRYEILFVIICMHVTAKVRQFKIFNNVWELWIFERGPRPAVICPTDSGTAAKLMPSQREERNKMAGNSYLVCSHQQ